MPNLSKHRVLLSGVLSPLLALVLNVILIQILLVLSSDPERNWRFRLVVSTLALLIPFLITLMLARRDQRNGSLSLSAKIGLAIGESTCSGSTQAGHSLVDHVARSDRLPRVLSSWTEAHRCRLCGDA
jgi:hypothetical protein